VSRLGNRKGCTISSKNKLKRAKRWQQRRVGSLMEKSSRVLNPWRCTWLYRRWSLRAGDISHRANNAHQRRARGYKYALQHHNIMCKEGGARRRSISHSRRSTSPNTHVQHLLVAINLWMPGLLTITTVKTRTRATSTRGGGQEWWCTGTRGPWSSRAT
jgi:hypothetical protein